MQCRQRGITPTLCAPYREWQKKHHHIRKGEKGIAIIAPHTYKTQKKDTDDETSKLGFHVAYTFDISQTEPDNGFEGPPEICQKLTGKLADAHLLDTLVFISPVPVCFEPVSGGANGYYKPDTPKIVVDDTNDESMQARVLIHEQCHAWHHKLDPDFASCPRADKEIIAESCAYTICNYLGIDTGAYSFGYLGSWGSKDQKELKTHLDLIRKISDRIISDIEAVSNTTAQTA